MNREPSIESNWEETIETFDEMGLKDELLRGVYSYGFERPSALQQKGIRPIILGRDTVCQAPSGTGKTAVYCIALLQLVDTSVNQCQVLVLCPTRELSQSLSHFIAQLGQYMNVRCHACVGGVVLSNNVRTLEKAAQVVVGTPGRVCDRLARKALGTQRLRLLVLDEADEVLCRGFNDQIQEILSRLPTETQVALFSATMPSEVLHITEQVMVAPVRVVAKRDSLAVDGVKQFYIAIEKDEWKFDTLCDLYENLDIAQVIIYCNTRRRVDQVSQAMREKDFKVSCIHGDMDCNARNEAMKDFRSGASRVLVTTDLLTNGIDIAQVSLIINYDMPRHNENYLHRIGRSGHYRPRGVAINFVTAEEVKLVRDLEQLYNTQIPELPLDLADIL